MKWFTYDQNNSGGYFIDNDDVSHLICVQSTNSDDANRKAHDITSDYIEYCECCGERWYISKRDEDGTLVPSQYGKPLSESAPGMYRETAILYFANGEKRKVRIGDPFTS